MALHLAKYLDAQAFSGKARLALERLFTAFLGEILTAGSGVTVTYNDETGEFEFAAASGSGVVETVVAGTGIAVDSTDPANPIVSATSSGVSLGVAYCVSTLRIY
jgi:hypothetical protein